MLDINLLQLLCMNYTAHLVQSTTHRTQSACIEDMTKAELVTLLREWVSSICDTKFLTRF